MKRFLPLLLALAACDSSPSSDDIQRAQQETILKEGTSQVGMPAIKNFRERRMLKDIIELRDQDGIVTYTYVWSDYRGQWVFFCNSIGYGMPAATQFTSPQKLERVDEHGAVAMPQADPNGLFSPSSAEGTWVLCKDPNGKDTKPVYLEPRVIVAPFSLEAQPVAVEASAIKVTPKK
jgi:hypothetical protein